MPTQIINNDDFISKGIWRKREICQDREHNPPSHIVLQPGQTMIHTCPSCNKITVVNGAITYRL